MLDLHAQRVYAPQSVLANGNWYKVAVPAEGMYSMDVTFLSTLGINTSNLSSASIRLYGNGGHMLAEANSGPWKDDLEEVAILVLDGGDGIFNNNDRILFYAPGPHQWIRDSANLRFTHRKNLYADHAYYFITIGGTGKRVQDAPVISSPAVTVNTSSERFFHELDTVNFLSSGKEWYGEEMSSLPGRSLTRTFSVNIPSIVTLVEV